MASVSKNSVRQCRVDETDIKGSFKVTVYPALMDLDMESNNMICAVKETFFKFFTDKYIAQRLKIGKETLLGNLVLDVVEIVERQIDYVRVGKIQMLKELQDKFTEVSKKLDSQVMKLYPDPKNQDCVQKRVANTVFEYNRRAEAARMETLDRQKKELFGRMLQKSFKEFEGNPTEVKQDSDAENSSPQSSSSGNPDEVRFKSNSKVTANNGVLDQSTTNQTGPSNPSGVPGPSPAPAQPPVSPELTDEQFNEAVKNTKLSDPENVTVEGLSGFSYVFQISPVSPDQFTVCADSSTCIGTLQADTLRVADVVERGDKSTWV